MAPLDTTTFLIVFTTAVVAIGGVIGVKFHLEKKKGR